MKLFLIPISSRRILIYCQRLNQITDRKPSIADRISAKVTKTWHQWEASDKSWQKSIADAGNKLLSRIPFEEWGLKSIPPLSARRQQAGVKSRKVKVVYPPSVVRHGNIPQILYQLATERQRLHRIKLWWSIIGMPIVAPLALVPLVPNIPFFYLAFRAWSYWKALSGGKHLRFLINNELIALEPSVRLDSVYQDNRVARDSRNGRIPMVFPANVDIKTAGEEDPISEELMLIREADAKRISKAVALPELAVEVERACGQVENKLLEGRKKGKEKKAKVR